MKFAKTICCAALLVILFSACADSAATPEPTTVSVPASATAPPTEMILPTAAQTPTAFVNLATALAGTRPPRTPVTPTRTRTTAPTRPPGAQSGKPEPTVLLDAKQIPETHLGRTQCLTCHEFGNVGPPMPQFHKDDKYDDNSICKRCHTGP